VVPDLKRIARECWSAVLVPLSDERRLDTVLHPQLGEDPFAVLDSLPKTVTARAGEALREPSSIPVPTAARRGSFRQVNFRLQDTEYEALAVAARLLGARPAQLARMFVLNGVRRALADQDAIGA
jgi:hypothetical protein